MRLAATPPLANDNGSRMYSGSGERLGSMERMSKRRRDLLKALGALGCLVLPARAPRVHAASSALSPANADYCSANPQSRPLPVPARDGWFARLAPDGAALTMRASNVPRGAGPWIQGFSVAHRGSRLINPTLVLKRGEQVRIALENALPEPTIVHWHGLGVDTRNDGAAVPPVPPGGRYSYAFDVRDRGALYWYHPHPHGLTAGQAYRGMFGLIEVEDEDERALRAALDLVPGKSEIALILQDRRGADYTTTAHDRVHGRLGDEIHVNGAVCPYLDVATRIYRFRIVNASNARTYRLGLRGGDGKSMPFTLIGSDAGLLVAPRRCDDAFLSTAERIDILVDLSDMSAGDSVLLETRAFDPMHMEASGPATAIDHAAMGHGAPPQADARKGVALDHEPMAHGGTLAEGVQRTLLQLRVRERIAYRAAIPARLSSIEPVDTSRAVERPLRLGFAKGQWRINDRVFSAGETPIEVTRDTVETWLIRNYFTSMPHAMHLHGFHFQVIERQTSPEQIAALKLDDRGRLATDLGWKDTIMVWPGESVKIAIDFALPFAGPQTYMFHCHNLEHEDGGMMLGVKVT
jgi:FtsP/CotA-like multicopper oxidase with cupredoxin domain